MEMRKPTRPGLFLRGVRAQWLRGATAALALAAAAAGGCLFQPREAELPEVLPPVDFQQPTSPEIALVNIEKSLEARYIPHYQNSFVPGEVVMEMDPGEYSEAGVSANPFPDWTRVDEAARMRQVISSMGVDTELDVIWGDTEGRWRDGDYYEDLEYSLVFTDGPVEIVYSGRVNLYYLQDGGLYLIWRWNDEQDATDHQTWCYLRHVQKWDYTP